MEKIYVYGVTAVGKTTWSKKLAQKKHVKYISGDALKEQYGNSKSGKKDAYAKIGTKSAWKIISTNPTNETVLMGLREMRKGINGYVSPLLNNENNFIFDAAYIDPSVFRKDGKVYLLVCLDEERHRERMFKRDKEMGEKNKERFSNARILQEVLIKEANRLKVPIIEIK